MYNWSAWPLWILSFKWQCPRLQDRNKTSGTETHKGYHQIPTKKIDRSEWQFHCNKSSTPVPASHHRSSLFTNPEPLQRISESSDPLPAVPRAASSAPRRRHVVTRRPGGVPSAIDGSGKNQWHNCSLTLWARNIRNIWENWVFLFTQIYKNMV